MVSQKVLHRLQEEQQELEVAVEEQEPRSRSNRSFRSILGRVARIAWEHWQPIKAQKVRISCSHPRKLGKSKIRINWGDKEMLNLKMLPRELEEGHWRKNLPVGWNSQILLIAWKEWRYMSLRMIADSKFSKAVYNVQGEAMILSDSRILGCLELLKPAFMVRPHLCRAVLYREIWTPTSNQCPKPNSFNKLEGSSLPTRAQTAHCEIILFLAQAWWIIWLQVAQSMVTKWAKIWMENCLHFIIQP